MATATATKPKKDLKIQPLEDRIVIRPADETESMRGGLYIPDTAKEKPTQGAVIAVGPGRLDDNGKRIPMDLKVGDQVIYGTYSGTNYTFEGDEYVIIKASDVLAKLG
jgi:chaperonin GroES